MSTLESRLARLRGFNAAVRGRDARLAEESLDLQEVREAGATPEVVERAIALESIVMRRQRPVLAIRKDQAVLEFKDPQDSEIWRERLEKASSHVLRIARATGRIELQNSRLDWVGTGWLIAQDVLVTNRHVAVEFAERRGQGFRFRTGARGAMSAAVDFRQEIGLETELVFQLKKPIHIEPEPGPDVAFFSIEVVSGDFRLATPIDLALRPETTENAATIGYPAYDSRIPERDLMEDIYGKIYDKKRLAPGGATRLEASRLLHNCTTLGGCSGASVFSLDSGEAIGLHFSGSFLDTNYAVRSDVVKALFDRMRGAGRRPSVPDGAQGSAGRPPTCAPKAVAADSPGRTTVTIPLQVTVSVSVGQAGARAAIGVADPYTDTDTDEDDADTETPPEDYEDRGGYDPEFLGSAITVELPVVERDAADVLPINGPGAPGPELRYEHFSVVMSRSRRMCFFSAANIDGGLSRKTKRVGWKWDSRLPKSQQIKQECYGDPPKFSRGHMTRREDPAWGDPETADRGNADSMHVTNATPQMQAFNAPIWLALEDYALEHARQDDMKICVFTGPYFGKRDPTYYGVRVPKAFWKVIAFIHDETGGLCATGYEMDQSNTLPPQEEFVFGAFNSPQLGIATQVSIEAIERRSGISFGGLAAVDPLGDQNESVDGGGAAASPLAMLEHIRFVR